MNISLDDISAEWAEVLMLKPSLNALFVILVEAWQRLHHIPILVLLHAHHAFVVLLLDLFILIFMLVFVEMSVWELFNQVLADRFLIYFQVKLGL